ncbi:MAG: WYL domain-containing protein [Rhodospirillales bacterium]|nr:WYL domain-containing protein [Rhodospirillales bacterium]
MEQANPGEIPKRWRIPFGAANSLLQTSAEELADLELAIKNLRRDNLIDAADRLTGLRAKIMAMQKPTTLRAIEPDLDVLVEAEGFALRPGPKPSISPTVLSSLKQAIAACVKVRLHYRQRETGTPSCQIVCPYGFLFGSRHYLVAYSMNTAVRDYRLFSLGNVDRVEVTEWPFTRREDFSLQAYAEKSFGVFQEEPFDVVWRFSKAVAGDVAEFLFHPTQTMEEQSDGTILVRFRAGGATEMCWHLFRWGGNVEILEPPWLAQKFEQMKAPAAARQS